MIVGVPGRFSSVLCQSSIVATMTEKQMSFSQSLFQVYFLGSLEVDRRCSSNVMPWLIEELKQELKNMNLVWITLGTY